MYMHLLLFDGNQGINKGRPKKNTNYELWEFNWFEISDHKKLKVMSLNLNKKVNVYQITNY